ncbi:MULTISPECIES: type III secretion system gatekeeper subunit SctW [Photorhabdus]|uniref:Type iii secretion control protein sctw n=2 Tax=Photorhabdus asymbiotica TaxID=291112 RepID=B6VK33_PHOAA|nr:type III secretion system gatekeeper subunit SctW [Photorhabdus asymbiotica]RKS66887.1 type III secretion outer membrane protein PopN [Photorhabdus asymbiotica]CAQ83145.1 type iii secretion control protein sctw [Photorhabdus asymbiotica]CAR66513.1 type iii secretion control protein sctw [Photorhabdus asymbiotica subsp. asymbiotica ATCC 43949]
MDIIQNHLHSVTLPESGAEITAQQEQAKIGQFQGEKVVLVAASQSLADAAEEMTFAFSERKDMPLSKRKVSDGHARVREIEALVSEYLQKVPDLERQQKIKALISHLNSGQLTNISQLQAYLESFSGEVSEQFYALSQARDALAGRPEARAMLALIEQELSRLAQEQGIAIELGARITPDATVAARNGVGNLQALRNIYRDAVMDYQGLSAAWRDIQSNFKNSPLKEVTGFIMKALVADLESQPRNIESAKLQCVMDDMKKLRLVNTVSAKVELLYKSVVKEESKSYWPSDLMGDVISLIEKRWANVRDVEMLGNALELQDSETQIYFFRELKQLIRLIPVEVFSDEEQRQNLLNSCQLVLDAAIEKEEDELWSGEGTS